MIKNRIKAIEHTSSPLRSNYIVTAASFWISNGSLAYQSFLTGSNQGIHQQANKKNHDWGESVRKKKSGVSLRLGGNGEAAKNKASADYLEKSCFQ